MNLSLFRRNLVRCGQTITLQNRNIAPPEFGSSDFDEDFTGDNDVQAIIKTERGKTLFDGVNSDTPITHKICIEYVSGVTSETWILLDGDRRLDVIDVENCCEKDEVLVLRCRETGTEEASKV